jgi:hypothetical protein
MLSFKSILSVSMIAVFVFISGMDAYSQSKVKIGTYDSRMVAVMFYNSKYFNLREEAKKRMEAAKEKNDSVEIANIMKEMPLRQRFMHEQVFGKGSVNWIMDQFKDKVSDIAGKEKVNIVVSKWELNYYGQGTEFIDLTEKICAIFGSEMDFKKMYSELQINEPVKDAFLIED